MTAERSQSIPITVLTGFLGSGKTTVLRHLGQRGLLNRTLVLVNEFGEVGLDHDLLSPIDDDTLVAVDSGCICCTIRADLVQALTEAPWRYARNGQCWFDQVIIETTGIADPAPILQTIIGDDRVAEKYALASVLTVVDVMTAPQTLAEHPEAVRQVAVADRILLTKTDLLDATDRPQLASLMSTLGQLAPAAPISTVVSGAAQADWFFGAGLYSLEGKSADVELWLQDELEAAHPRSSDALHAHEYVHDKNRHGRIEASCLTFDQPVDASLFESCLQMLMQFRGADLIRVKGIINVQNMDRPMVIHGVQHVFHPPEILPEWPSDNHRTRLVVIAQDLDHQEISACFSALGMHPTAQCLTPASPVADQ